METDDLATYLSSLDRDSCYRVDAVYKECRLETTERVFFVGENGAELGPFVRKHIDADAGLGGAYETVFQAQRSGVRLPHLPRIVECFRKDGRIVVVMEHVEGETLAERVARLASPSARHDLARRDFPEVCDAVSELHELLDPPVIHRDLKPSNVMLSGDGASVTLIDLGIARAYREGANQDTTHFGTRAYAPPEQFGFGQTGVTSDVYALGMLLFFCLAGREPSARDREEAFSGSGIPSSLREVVVRATRLDPAVRFSTVRELKEAFLSASSSAGEKDVPLQPPTFEPERPALGTLLSRVPGWLGFIWDLVVLGAAGLLVVGCVMGVAIPTPSNASWPMWYRCLSYLVCLLPMLLIGCYLLLDRRPLRREVPALARLSVRQETRTGLLVILGLFVVWVTASVIAGV